MKTKNIQFDEGFRVVFANNRSQAAEMTLAPGDSEGGPENRHRGADQWLFVVTGKGEAVVNHKKYLLESGTLLLIEHGDKHEIRNTGEAPLRTLNFYVPPAYTAKGDELPAGKSE
jgi:mannose-6-phosphate isomerase-like protein (cupin superfamily)